MSTAEVESRGAGRPMSSDASDRILDAAVHLLGERGWEGLTMEALAACAAVGKATIYRRWPSKEAIVTAAMERFVDDIRLHDTGSLSGDLEALLQDAVRAYRSPRGALLPVLASVMDRQPDLAKVIRRTFFEPRRRAVAELFERAQVRGEIAPEADLGLIHDLLVGPLMFRRLYSGLPLGPKLVRGLVKTIVAGFGPNAKEEG